MTVRKLEVIAIINENRIKYTAISTVNFIGKCSSNIQCFQPKPINIILFSEIEALDAMG